MFDKFLKNGATFVFILACITFISRCDFNGEQKTTPSQIETVIIHDTIPGDSFPYIVYRDAPLPDTVYQPVFIPAKIDTAAILSDYFASVVYSDTLQNDTSYFIVITDTITQNRIAWRSVWFQNLRPMAINTTITYSNAPKKHTYFLGGQLGASKQGSVLFAPSVLHASPKGRAQSLGFDILSQKFMVGYYYNIQ